MLGKSFSRLNIIAVLRGNHMISIKKETQATCFLSYSCHPLTVSWWHTHYICELRGDKTQRTPELCISVITFHLRTTSSNKTWQGITLFLEHSSSTDRPLKGQRPVNVNGLSRVRLNRLPTSILHLPPTHFPHLTAPATSNTHKPLNHPLSHLVPTVSHFMSRSVPHCHFYHLCGSSSSTQLLCNLWLSVIVCVWVFAGKRERLSGRRHHW